MASIWPKLLESEVWSVGDGTSINAWHDRWIDSSMKLIDVNSKFLLIC